MRHDIQLVQIENMHPVNLCLDSFVLGDVLGVKHHVLNYWGSHYLHFLAVLIEPAQEQLPLLCVVGDRIRNGHAV